MNIQFKRIVVCTALSLTLLGLGGCASRAVSPSERDTSGTYDGVWVGTVAKPRSSKETLPGNWTMSCDWEPYEFHMVVDDGRVQLGKLEQKWFVSEEGRFLLEIDSGLAGMTGGEMEGNGKFLHIISGVLSGSSPTGKYLQLISSIGGNGCNSKIRFRRHTDEA